MKTLIKRPTVVERHRSTITFAIVIEVVGF